MLQPHKGGDTYAHRSEGPCRCGVTHGDVPQTFMEKSVRKPAKKEARAKPVEIVSLDEVRQAYGRNGKITDEYSYEDEIDGQWREVLRVFRIKLPDDDEGKPQKDFRQASPEGNGWKMSQGSARLVPFHLRQLLEAIDAGDPVHIVEGEKDVLAVEEAGGVATCNPMGAGKDVAPYAEYFHGADLVYIVADRDEPGRSHARAWATELRLTVQRFEIVEPVEGKDAHDVLSTHGQHLDDAFKPSSASDEDRPHLVSLADVNPEPIEWLWTGYIPKGKLTDVVGDGDLGKSLVMLDIAARMTQGMPMPGEPENTYRKPLNVVLLAAEDDLADTVVPRLIAAGADLKRIKALEGPREGVEQPITFPEDLAALEAAIRQMNAGLVVIDPVMAFLGSKVKSGIDADVRTALLTPLKKMASKYDCAVLNLRHTNKNEGASASMRGGGSTAFRNATRAGLAFGPDHHDEHGERRIMAPSKNNLGRRRDAIAYRIKSTFGHVESEGSEGTPIVVWEGCVSGVTAADVLGPPSKEPGPRDGTKTAEATSWLRNRLAGGIAVKATIIQEEMGAAHFSKSVIESAKRYAKVKSERISRGNGGEGYSLWSLG